MFDVHVCTAVVWTISICISMTGTAISNRKTKGFVRTDRTGRRVAWSGSLVCPARQPARRIAGTRIAVGGMVTDSS